MTNPKIYYSVGLNDSLPNKRTSGKIILEKNFLVFSHESHSFKLSLEKLKVRIGGSGNGLVFFHHPDFPDWDFYTSDKSIIRDPIAKKSSCFDDVRLEDRNNLLKVGSVVLLIAVFITGLIYLFRAFKDSMTYAIAAQIPTSIEKSIGDATFKSYIAGKKIYKDKQFLEKLKPITDRLLENTKNSGYEFKFHVVEDSHINAIAFPGGNILIHSALIKEAESPEEIAGVLAHEISHVTLKHGLRHILNSVGLFIVVQSLFGDFSGLIAIITQNTSIFLSSRFSRDFEREADARGFNYLVNSKINPKGLSKFFKKILEMEKEEGITDNEIVKFISTHPDTKERIDTIEQKASSLKDEDFTPITIDLKQIQKSLKGLE
ncbi:MAG: M48 family metallopeptidase [Leptospiraceae bacterium]|nr:M48 family metallopeptidase [Leptospiraceae bacterium]